MLSSHLHRLALTTPPPQHAQGTGQSGSSVCVIGVCGVLRLPGCQIGGPSRGGIPSGSWASFLMESTKKLVGSLSLWCPTKASAASHLSVMQPASAFWTGQELGGSFSRHPHTWEIWVWTHLLLLSSVETILILEALFRAQSYVPGEKGDADKVKLLLLLILMHPILDFIFFLQQCAGISSLSP